MPSFGLDLNAGINPEFKIAVSPMLWTHGFMDEQTATRGVRTRGLQRHRDVACQTVSYRCWAVKFARSHLVKDEIPFRFARLKARDDTP